MIQFKRGDIVVSAPGWSAGCYCILEVHPNHPKNPYSGVNLATNKHYGLSDEGFIKVGTAGDEFLSGELDPAACAIAKDKLII